MFSTALIRKISELDPPVRETILLLMEEVERERARWEESVTKAEFNELKEIVHELGKSVAELVEAQKRTEKAIRRLTERMEKAEERLDKLEKIVQELAEAQKKTEEEIRKLTLGLSRTRRELGGLARSVAYALENEAYRHLPAFLKEYHNLEVLDRFVRTYLDDKEINIFARARRNGEEVLLVGETALKLESAGKLKQLQRKIKLVEKHWGRPVIPLLVTHFAHPKVLEKAKKAGILVIQSFEWI